MLLDLAEATLRDHPYHGATHLGAHQRSAYFRANYPLREGEGEAPHAWWFVRIVPDGRCEWHSHAKAGCVTIVVVSGSVYLDVQAKGRALEFALYEGDRAGLAGAWLHRVRGEGLLLVANWRSEWLSNRVVIGKV